MGKPAQWRHRRKHVGARDRLTAYTYHAKNEQDSSQYPPYGASLVGKYIINSTISNTGGNAIEIDDEDLYGYGGCVTDGKLQNNVISMPAVGNVSHNGIFAQLSAGWWIQNNTIQGLDGAGYPGSGMIVNGTWSTHISGNVIKGFGFAGATRPRSCVTSRPCRGARAGRPPAAPEARRAPAAGVCPSSSASRCAPASARARRS